MMSYEINGKRLELLRWMFPQVTHVGVLSNPMRPGEYGELKVTEATAEKLGLKPSYGRIVSAADVELAFNLVRSKGADAVTATFCPARGNDPLSAVVSLRLAAQQRIPVKSPLVGRNSHVQAGSCLTDRTLRRPDRAGSLPMSTRS